MQARATVDADFYKNTFSAINTSWGNALRVAPLLKQARNLSGLERMLGSTRMLERNSAICALQWTYTPEAAAILVKHYVALNGTPRTYLKKMGPVAAPAVAQMLKAADPEIRRDGCSILEYIGTSEQLGALIRLQLDPDGIVQSKSTSAAKKIEASGR